jgi:hypothetical protein
MEITTLARQMAGVLLDELALRPGTDLVARVAAAPANGGRGVISLAGVLLSAQLPAGLAAGQRLPVRVVRAGGDEVLLKLRPEGVPAEAVATSRPLAQAAGTLAVTGDGQLLRVADGLAQTGLALPLPNGDALTLQVADEAPEQGGEGASAPDGAASFVLHSAALGPIEARLRLTGGALAIEIVVEPSARQRFAAAVPALVEALERANTAPALVGVEARRSRSPRPVRPPVDESFDAYA